MAERELLQQALDALDDANVAIVSGMCFHETTHRGGVIWTICDDCGAKWADDRGGFQKPTMPKAWVKAQAAAAAIRAALGVPVVHAAEFAALLTALEAAVFASGGDPTHPEVVKARDAVRAAAGVAEPFGGRAAWPEGAAFRGCGRTLL